MTSLTVDGGRLFASLGSCTSSVQDAPADVRGSVFSLQAGQCVSFDEDLGPGWKQLVAMRADNKLKLYVNGRPVAESASFDGDQYDLTVDLPPRIGFGEQDYFTGRIREVRLYRRALSAAEIEALPTPDEAR